MLVDLHGHHMTQGMMNLDPYWGPEWSKEHGTLRVGDWFLGTKKLPEVGDGKQSDKHGDAVFDRLTHEFRLQLMAQMDMDVLVVSQPAHMFMYWAEDFGVRFAKIANDEIGAWAAEDPAHFLWWASLPMHRPQEAAAELERAVGMGAVGFMCGGANFGGLDIHSPELDVVWAKTVELDVPVFIHGYNQSASWGKDAMTDPFDTTSILGMCYDETRAFWHMICGGVLDRFPSLRVYITHSGGFVPYQLVRLAETNQTMAPDSVNQRPLLEYMPNFWFDTQIRDVQMRKAMIDIIGPDQMVVGTNFLGSDHVNFDTTADVGLSDVDREKMRSGNAINNLLKIADRIKQPA